jgi:hypothetical protein
MLKIRKLFASCVGFLLGLFFDPGDGGDILLRNVGWFSTDYTALCPGRCKSLQPNQIYEGELHHETTKNQVYNSVTWCRNYWMIFSRKNRWHLDIYKNGCFINLFASSQRLSHWTYFHCCFEHTTASINWNKNLATLSLANLHDIVKFGAFSLVRYYISLLILSCVRGLFVNYRRVLDYTIGFIDNLHRQL